MHLLVELAFVVLCRAGRCNQGGIHHRSGLEHQPVVNQNLALTAASVCASKSFCSSVRLKRRMVLPIENIMKFKFSYCLMGYICLAISMVACVTVEQDRISSEYLKSLSVHRKGSNRLEISDKSECLSIVNKINHYDPIYRFRECLVQRGYVLLN